MLNVKISASESTERCYTHGGVPKRLQRNRPLRFRHGVRVKGSHARRERFAIYAWVRHWGADTAPLWQLQRPGRSRCYILKYTLCEAKFLLSVEGGNNPTSSQSRLAPPNDLHFWEKCSNVEEGGHRGDVLNHLWVGGHFVYYYRDYNIKVVWCSPLDRPVSSLAQTTVSTGDRPAAHGERQLGPERWTEIASRHWPRAIALTPIYPKMAN